MKHKISTKKAFTLLEILIATAIFSSVMVLTSGIISQSSGSQTKLKANREVSEESRHLADLISRDIRTAEGSFTAKIHNTDTNYYEFRNGIALFSCATTVNWTCEQVYTNFVTTDSGPSNINNDPTEYHANAMLIYSNGSVKAYISTSNAVYSATYNITDSTYPITSYWVTSNKSLNLHSSLNNSIFKIVVANSANMISNSNLDITVDFTGFASANKMTLSGSTFTIATPGTDLQSYVSYYIGVKTKNFSTAPTHEKAETFIRSLVTPRNYSM